MQLAVLEWRIVISSVFGIEKMWNDMLWWYSIDLMAWCPASYVCCVCIDPLPICFLAVMNELAIYSYMSECSCFKLMNYNPTLSSNLWPSENVKESMLVISWGSAVMFWQTMGCQGGQKKLKLFQKHLISRSLERPLSLNVQKHIWRKL